MITLYPLFQQLPDNIVDTIVNTGGSSASGWGVALLMSLIFNYLIFKEFKMLQSKYLTHLESFGETIKSIDDKIESLYKS